MNKTTACELFLSAGVWTRFRTCIELASLSESLKEKARVLRLYRVLMQGFWGQRFDSFSADPDISRAFGETQRSCRPAFLIVYVHLGLLVRLSTGCRSCPTAWVPLRIWLPMRESLWVGRPLFCEIRAAPAWLHVALCCPAAQSAIFPTSSWLEPRAPLVVFSLRRLIASPQISPSPIGPPLLPQSVCITRVIF